VRVVIVGAGVVGGSVAYRLAAGGADVALVDAGRPGSGTTARSFAWLNGNDKQPTAYGQLNAEGIAAHHRLAADLGRSPWLHPTGNLMVTRDDPDPLEARVARLRALDYPAELVDVARAAALEPAVDFAGARAIAWFPAEAWAHGPTLATVLAEAAAERGARVMAGASVVGLDGRGVALASGERLEADAVVLAAGRFTDRLGALAGLHVPLRPTSGLLAVTSPVVGGPSRVVYTPELHFRPDGGGRYVLQADDGDRSVSADSPEEPAQLPMCGVLLERARRYVPALGAARVESARVGTRPMPVDGLPIVGPAVAGLYVVVTHSGMTLGPLLGELAAAELLGAEADARLAPYRPRRCVTPL
jgi:glycine/D-amino acid oxidase-like deaminating enzyme